MTRAEILKTAKPILFNTEMVRAILEGRKTVTRRVVKNLSFHEEGNGTIHVYEIHNGEEDCSPVFGGGLDFVNVNAAYYALYRKGDILYVRETWYYENHMHDLTAGEPDLPDGGYSHRYVYRASSPDYPVDKWKPSIHMPKEAARIFLKVTDVRVEKLQDITTQQAKAEGVFCNCAENEENRCFKGNVGHFKELWDSTIKTGDSPLYSWNANPWVWVYEFERVNEL